MLIGSHCTMPPAPSGWGFACELCLAVIDSLQTTGLNGRRELVLTHDPT